MSAWAYCSYTRSEAPGTERLLFCAGAVDINLLFSMIQQWHLNQAAKPEMKSRAVLLYSGRARRELLFDDWLAKLVNEVPGQFRVICTPTKGPRASDGAKDRCQHITDDGEMSILFGEVRIYSEMIGNAIT